MILPVSQSIVPHGSHDDILRFMLPRLHVVQNNVAVLSDPSQPLKHNRAIVQLLDSLQIGAEVALDWTPRFMQQPAIEIDYPDPMHTRFIFNIGERIHSSLDAQGLLWPPPHRMPPPAVTRDLLELYRQASIQLRRSSDEPLDVRLRHALSVIRLQSSRLSQQLQDRISLDVPQDTLALPLPEQRSLKNRATVMLSGLALAIGLAQGPGVVNNFYDDIVELGENVEKVSRIIGSGVTTLAEGIERTLNEQWNKRID